MKPGPEYHVAALCFQKYTYCHLCEGQEVMEGMTLMAPTGRKSCALRPKPTTKAVKTTDSVGGRGYIELSWCWPNIPAWFL